MLSVQSSINVLPWGQWRTMNAAIAALRLGKNRYWNCLHFYDHLVSSIPPSDTVTRILRFYWATPCECGVCCGNSASTSTLLSVEPEHSTRLWIELANCIIAMYYRRIFHLFSSNKSNTFSRKFNPKSGTTFSSQDCQVSMIDNHKLLTTEQRTSFAALEHHRLAEQDYDQLMNRHQTPIQENV